MTVYYNDNEPFIGKWLAQLVAEGHLPEGVLDDGSIKDVSAELVQQFTHAHFFAGIGGWPLALAMAGWPDDRPVWTGSCPCQPFSVAGQRKGTADDRHLWPAFRELIAKCRPPTIFGEQVASADGRKWLAGVRADLEALGYAVGAADLCAAGVGAPHIRQRLFWVADANSTRLEGLHAPRRRERVQSTQTHVSRNQWKAHPDVLRSVDGVSAKLARPVDYRGGISGFGNAIVPQVAAEFIKAFLHA